MQGFDNARQHAQLVHIATDGESYGHHHPHGDMALAYVLRQLSQHPEIRLTNYGEFLELHPPEWEVEIHEKSSWSCVHGIERWRSNCGCNMGRGWQQQWRGPLRDALDQLRSRLDHLFATRGRQCFPDPWAAREEYIRVILDRRDEVVDEFLRAYAHPDLDDALICDALWFLEMQRHAMLMYTSCGWFFDEISGLETTQCLRYAARALQLARHFDLDAEEEFVQALQKAPSNLPQLKNGRGVWEQFVRPAKIDLQRVLAHFAMSLIYGQTDGKAHVYCYDVECRDVEVRARGSNHLAIGRLQVRSRITRNDAEAAFVVIHFGGLDFHTVLRAARSPAEHQAFKQRLLETHKTGSLADVTTLVAQEFVGEVHRLDDLFVEEQRRIIGIVLRDRFEDYRRSFERLADQDEDVLNILGALHYPIPKPLRAAAAASLDHRLRLEIEQLGANGSLANIRRLLERGKPWGYQPERLSLGSILAEELRVVFGEINPLSDLPALTERACQLLDAAALLGIPLDIWQIQNQLLDAYAELSREAPVSGPLKKAFCQLAAKLNISQDLLGWRP
jgi:hypothetical protein